MTRSDVLDAVARRLVERDPGHPLRVGVDGVCGVGKSTFAEELVGRIAAHGRPAILLDSDGFHHVRAVRYRQGRESARGYYEDAYDFDALRDLALRPLGPGGSRRYAARVHDLATDEVRREFATAPGDAVVVFAATFLQRDGLREHWDEVVYLDASIERAEGRGIVRDAEHLGGRDAAEQAYAFRYMAACRIYLDEQDPRGRASIVVDHDDPLHPRVVEPRA
ncbi:uridine kinase [Agromyces aurantiacus]|uniref:Uridine kinase n=1 Tax=Agromyces aurantiacus TaxID=165814 RepID=A0ABV9R680_9MICO|nr:uridine kinase [Agromyces aurantiacus]MBM7503908.1 uridine kinase [Agromyces aurantiacus]